MPLFCRLPQQKQQQQVDTEIGETCLRLRLICTEAKSCREITIRTWIYRCMDALRWLGNCGNGSACTGVFLHAAAAIFSRGGRSERTSFSLITRSCVSRRASCPRPKSFCGNYRSPSYAPTWQSTSIARKGKNRNKVATNASCDTPLKPSLSTAYVLFDVHVYFTSYGGSMKWNMTPFLRSMSSDSLVPSR